MLNLGRSLLHNPTLSSSAISVRAVSSKYPRPTPRHYKRRLFEEAVQPVLPRQLQACIPPGLIHQQKLKEGKEYTDYENALAGMVKSWIRDNEFRVMAVCQFLPVQGRTLWMSKNHLRLKGIEFKNYGNKIMNKVFDNTPLSSLSVSLVGSNAFLFGRTVEDVKTIVQETEKLNWIVPLVFVMDGRIISGEQAKQLAGLRSLDDIRVETAQILESQLGSFPATLDRATRDVVSTLSNLEQMKSGTDGSGSV